MTQSLTSPSTKQPIQPTTSYAVEEDKQAQADAKALDTSKKTTGEKWFHNITYWAMNFIGTFAISGVIGYFLKYSDSKVPFANTSWKDGWKSVSQTIGDWKIGKEKKVGAETAENVLMTTALMMGGNLMIIPVKFMEKNKKGVVQYFNRKFGKPEEIEIYEKRHESVPTQSWGSLLKGRIVAWLTVFVSLQLASKVNAIKTKMGQFDNWCGEKLCQITGKPIEGSKDGKSGTFRLGSIFGVDAFATAAAVLLLDVFSHAFIKKDKPTDHSPIEEAKSSLGVPIKEPKAETKNNTPPPAVVKGEKIDSEAKEEVEKSIKEKVPSRQESYSAERKEEKTRQDSEVQAFGVLA